MTPTLILASTAVSFVYIFLKALQQLNVVHGNYGMVPVTSICMGVCEVSIVLFVVHAGSVWLGVANGLGASVGAVLAMRVHGRFVRRRVL